MRRSKIKRILLLAAPAYSQRGMRDIQPLPPLGLGYLASMLEKENFDVSILDCLMKGWENEKDVDENRVLVGLDYAEIEERVKRLSPDLVGVNCQFSCQHTIYHEVLALIKKIDPDIVTLAGGAHTSVCQRSMLEDPNCDFTMVGESDRAICDLMMAYNNSSKLDEIDGLGWKRNGQLMINEKKSWIEDLDAIPYPAYHLMSLEDYHGLEKTHGERNRRRFCPIVTSRGCPAKCTFCSAHKVWGRRYRTRSVENIIGEMRLLEQTYGIEEIMFEDDNVTVDRTRAKRLFSRMIEEKFNFVWDTPNGVGAWSLDEEMIDLMKAAGCVKLNFPVESGSERVLRDIIRKPVKLDHIRKMVKHCQEIGLDYGMFFVLGMPGETMSDIRKTLDFSCDCKCFSPVISIAVPYPGTELRKICEEMGYYNRSVTLEDLYTESYCLETNDWTAEDIKNLVENLDWYFKMRKLRTEPVKTIVNWSRKGMGKLIETIFTGSEK